MHTVPRLITSFAPSHYTLSLDLQRQARTFHGTVDIRGETIQASGEVRLHAKDLTIKSVLLDGKKATFHTTINDELIITHSDNKPGKHLLTISFSGTITDGMHGLYPCYFEHNGIKKELLATQFESHHAREVFPCIDEPEAKATFDLTLSTEPDITVLGNMPVKIQRTEKDRLVTIFETTPRMSTYLLAWVVGELHRKTATTKTGVEVNIWATPVQPASSLDFALETAVKSIEFFNEYFGVEYPLPKSDHVALPDFSSGAMENWGLITYRERALLFEPATTSLSSKQYIALVIAHELSHQWFGNLVTMKWWNNLWLNESFATLMEYIAVDVLHPEWNIWLDFSTTENTLALRRDSSSNVQPVQTEVNHPDEITMLFDSAIVYAKGARLLRMLHQLIGDTAFRKGLRAYFTSHAYKNTEASDLWRAFSSTSGHDVSAFMNTWISQPGYPVVAVEKTATNTIRFRQNRFFVGKHAASAQLWPIPLGTDLPELPKVFETSELVTTASKIPRLNAGDSAHFITRYSEGMIEQLLISLDTSTPLDRLQLLHEQILLTRSGYIPPARLVKLLYAYRKEASEQVWNIMRLALDELKKFVDDDPKAKDDLQALAATLARKQYERLGWQQLSGEPESDTKLRNTIISLMLYAKDPSAIKTALKLQAATPLEQLNPELRPLILATALRRGTDPTFFSMLVKEYTETTSPEQRSDILAALTSTEVPAQVHHLLDLLTTNAVRHQDTPRWFIALLANPASRDASWQWLQNNWPWITQYFKGDKSYDVFPRHCGGILANRSQLHEFDTFFSPIMKTEPGLKRIIAIAHTEIEARVEIIEANAAEVKNALRQLNKSL
jgi:aminopeptidase N